MIIRCCLNRVFDYNWYISWHLFLITKYIDWLIGVKHHFQHCWFFRGGSFLLVKETGVHEENHWLSEGKQQL